MHVRTLVTLIALGFMGVACADPNARKQEPRYTIVRPVEQSATAAGISPDKEAEIQLVLQQRETSTRRCYQEALDEKADRSFAGNVKLIITVQPLTQLTNVASTTSTLVRGEPAPWG